MPPSIWPSTASGLSARPTSCAVAICDHPDQPELGVDVDHGPVGGERERHVALPWPFSSSGVGRAVVVLDGRLDGVVAEQRRPATRVGAGRVDDRRPSISQRRPASSRGRATCARTCLAPPARPSAPRRPSSRSGATPTSTRPSRPAVSAGWHDTSSTPSTVAGDLLPAMVTKPWPTSAAAVCTVDHGSPLDDRQPDARGRVVVEALGEHEVLEADRVARRRAGRPRRASVSDPPAGQARAGRRAARRRRRRAAARAGSSMQLGHRRACRRAPGR